MTLIDLCKLIKDITQLQVYPVIFPNGALDCLKIEVMAGEEIAGGVNALTVQIMTKADHPAKAEQLIQAVKKKMNFTDKDFKEHNIILCRSYNEPFYVGETDTHCHIFSIDIHMIIDTVAQCPKGATHEYK